MTEKREEPGRDAVLNERKQSKPYLFHHRRFTHDAWWKKLIRYIGLSSWGTNIDIDSMDPSKLDDNHDRTDLASTFNKLKACCEEDETDLKAAIKYGLTVISPRKHRKLDQKNDDIAASRTISGSDTAATHHN